MFVVSGPGGVGKGTLVAALLQREPKLWLSRSWTTRERRPGESPDAYVFVDRDTFERRIEADGFLEWTDFLGNYYGTPTPDPPPGADVVLEIELDGAQQVRKRHPDAIVIFVMPPSREEQERRLRGRGDPEEKVAKRLRKADEEEPIGLALADHVIVNDDLDRAVSELLAVIESHQRRQ
ncbi:MAG TPA: guanylate kinase [Acidimicrobiales bacterium]|nr:guanylate kinase [Acidimicrobiales bacterium]